MKVLFIGNKWCAGDPRNGLSEWERGWQDSLVGTRLAQVKTIHYDVLKDKGNRVLLQTCQEWKPDLMVLILMDLQMVGMLEKIKKQLKIPMMAVWGDLEIPNAIKLSQQLSRVADWHLYTATSAVGQRIKSQKPYIYSWVPKDSRVFFNPQKARDIDVSYAGSPRTDRRQYVDYLKQHGIKVVEHGGERSEHLPVKEFAKLMQRSKISLSFSYVVYSPVVHSRTFEATNCGSMLLEQFGPETAKLFVPMQDYVPFFNKKDMLEKARYYLTHDKEREAIALNGWHKCQKLYSAKQLWQRIFKMSKGKKQPLLPTNLSLEQLRFLPRQRIWQLKLADFIYNNPYLYFLVYNSQRIWQYATTIN